MPLRVDGAEMPPALGDKLYLELSLDDVEAAVDRLLADIASSAPRAAGPNARGGPCGRAPGSLPPACPSGRVRPASGR